MVAGAYAHNNSYEEQTPPPLADEDSQYDRRDFLPATSTANASAATGFLVRMRRTYDTSGIDNEPGVSSGGSLGQSDGNHASIPFLFGRGSLIHKAPASFYSPREQGIAVRATTIAAAGSDISFDGGVTSYSVGRAKAVGPPVPDYHIPGTTPFAMSRESWTSLDVALRFGSSPSNTLQIGQLLSAMGESFTSVQAIPATGSLPNAGYVPIYATYGDNNIKMIIGFGYVQWSWDGTILMLVRPKADWIGSENVSGVLVRDLELPNDTSGNPIVTASKLFHDHAALPHPLYAPVLVNRFIGRTNP
jgi:hypothetical protein